MKESILKLLKDRYFLPNEDSWEQLAERVGKIYDPITEYVKNMMFVPSTPTLMNANTRGKRVGTLSSCFPMNIEDSIEGIFDSLKEAALVTKYGGGVGYDFSNLRSEKEFVKGIGGRMSSGPLPFIKIFNEMLDGVQQGGSRRGAGMALLDIEHPSILAFIKEKQNLGTCNRFNFSIKVSDQFYKDLDKNPDKIHKVKLIDGKFVDLLDEIEKPVTVKQLWDLIIDCAWTTAEPGLFNRDIAFRQCTVTNIDKTVICNPCSEFSDIPYSSCNLGSINLSKLVFNGVFNWNVFSVLIGLATRFLDSVIDHNKFPIKKIEFITKKIRPLGLGFMGLAHCLYKMKIAYNSKEAYKFAETMSRYLTLRSMQESVELAKEAGTSYPAFDYDLFMTANKRFFIEDKCQEIDVKKLVHDIKKFGIRNSSQTSIAPTGSISTICMVSGGMEPLFALTYARKIEKLNKEYDILYVSDPIFDEYLNENFTQEQKTKILQEVADDKGSCRKCKDIPEEWKKIFVVASDLNPIEHLDILQSVAINTSLSVSKTINLPNSCSKEEIGNVYREAHKRGVIGVTVYRDGCREGILVHNLKDEEIINYHDAPKRPKSLPCHVYRISVFNKVSQESEKWIVFVGLFKNHPYEVFAGKVELVDLMSSIEEGAITKVKSGIYQFEYNGEVLIKDIRSIFHSDVHEALTRLISSCLRHGVRPEFINEQLSKSDGNIVDFNKAIIRAFKKYIKEQETGQLCPKCNNKMIYAEGCVKCLNPECGFAKCG